MQIACAPSRVARRHHAQAARCSRPRLSAESNRPLRLGCTDRSRVSRGWTTAGDRRWLVVVGCGTEQQQAARMDPPVYADAEEAQAAEKAAKKAAKKKKREKEKAKENKRKRGEEAAGRPSTESQDDEAAVVSAPATIVYNSGSLAIHKLEIADLVQDEEILKNALVSKPRDQLPRMLSIQGWLETVRKATKTGAPGTPEQVRARAGRCSSHPPLCVGPHTDCVLRAAACAQFPLLAELRKLPRAVVIVNPVDHARTAGGVYSPEQLSAAG